MSTPQGFARWLRWWFAGYIVLIAAVTVAMFCAHRSTVSQMSSPESISAWQAWRGDVFDEQSQPGPVERRVPNSDEPPALVLMRDYFPVLMIGALVFISMPYWIIAWFVTGMISSNRQGEVPAEPKA